MWRERYLRGIEEVRENEPKREMSVYATWFNSGHKIKKEWIDLKAFENAPRSLFRDGTVGATKCSTGKGND